MVDFFNEFAEDLLGKNNYIFNIAKSKFNSFKELKEEVVVVTSQEGGRGVDFVFASGSLSSHVIINFLCDSSAALRQIVGRSCGQRS